MQNRFLSRGKRIDNGEWVEGYLYGIWERRYILWGMTNDIPNMVEVDPETVCQCTAMPDKNGKLILRMIFFQGISTLGFQKMRRESVSCGMKTDGVRMSRAVMTTRNWMILIQRILK